MSGCYRLPHRRSSQGQIRYDARKEYGTIRLLQHQLAEDYCFHDPLNGEWVWTEEHEPIVEKMLNRIFDGAVYRSALNHDFGDVLNR